MFPGCALALAMSLHGAAADPELQRAEPPIDEVDSGNNRSQASQTDAPDVAREVFSGHIVLLREELIARGMPTSEEFSGLVALKTESGELIPLIPDWRGRAVFQDNRLRDRKVELVGMRRPGIPLLQVLIIFVFDDAGQRQYMDYWCDVCAIPMYEIKPCECCQGDIRIRFQHRDLPDYVTTIKPPTATDSPAKAVLHRDE